MLRVGGGRLGARGIANSRVAVRGIGGRGGVRAILLRVGNARLVLLNVLVLRYIGGALLVRTIRDGRHDSGERTDGQDRQAGQRAGIEYLFIYSSVYLSRCPN